MKVSKSTINVLLVIGFILLISVGSLRVIQESRIQAFVSERNEICANLSYALSEEDGLDDCYCYYEGFKTGNEELDGETLPLCSCECVINGTSYKIGIVEPKA
jgi:hypothetical protein